MHLFRAADASDLAKRYYCNYSYSNGGYSNCNSRWSRWGRWVLAGVLILVGLLFFLTLMFITQRRRRRNRLAFGNAPMPVQQQQQMGATTAPYNNNNNVGEYSPPMGAPPPMGNAGYGNGGASGANADYYGGARGVQEPSATHVKA